MLVNFHCPASKNETGYLSAWFRSRSCAADLGNDADALPLLVHRSKFFIPVPASLDRFRRGLMLRPGRRGQVFAFPFEFEITGQGRRITGLGQFIFNDALAGNLAIFHLDKNVFFKK